MKQIINAFLILGFVALAACSGMTVYSDYDKTVDFTNYKTFSYYGWADNSDKILSPFDKERIEKAFGQEFLNRDLTFVKEGGDLVVALYIVTEQKQQTTATTTGMGGAYGGYGGYYGYGPGWGWGGGVSTTTVNTYDYTVGTLVCSVFDANEKKLIWEGSGSGEIDENPQTREDGIPKAVAKIMAQYPVPAAKK
jgi:hypothetical protein